MPVTAIDKQTALVLIDLQKSIVSRPLAPHTSEEILANTNALIAAFRKADLPIVLVNVTPRVRPVPLRTDFKMPPMQFNAEWAEITPEVDAQEHDIRVTKHSPSAFYDTSLDEELKKRGVTGIVLGGIATSIGVEATV